MNKTLKLSLTALLTALSVAANFLTIPVAPNKFVSFTVLFSFIAGIYLGVIPAVAVGFLGDLIGHIIHPFGAYNCFVGLSCALAGFIPALIYKTKLHKLLKLIISLVVFFVTCSAFLNTFGLWLQIIVGVDASPIGLWQYFTMDKSGIRKSFWVYLAGRLPVQLLNLAVNGVLIGLIQQSKVLDKLILKVGQSKEKASDAKTTETAD